MGAVPGVWVGRPARLKLSLENERTPKDRIPVFY